ncbi:MAG: putative cytosolic protein [Paenibacillus sp.]|jgi:uncharacterized protein YciI|nr:putative cytosolic protein [Paenibacillus sp.]
MKFMIYFRPGEAWISGKSVFDQSLSEHGTYMQMLYDAKILLMGGPFLDDSGGIAIIEVSSEEEAATILKDCPAIVHKVFKAELHPLLLVFDLSAGLSLLQKSDDSS